MYKALIDFTDLQDSGYVYHAGDKYPREGYAPADKRVKELAGTNNKLGNAVIAEYEDIVKDNSPEKEPPEEPKTEKRPKRRKTK